MCLRANIQKGGVVDLAILRRERIQDALLRDLDARPCGQGTPAVLFSRLDRIAVRIGHLVREVLEERALLTAA